MQPAGLVTLTMRELDRFKAIQDVADGKLKPRRAAEQLELTTRQIEHLVLRRCRAAGVAGLVSGKRGRINCLLERRSGRWHCYADFEDRAPACTLLVFIDDATGRLMALHFTANESTFSYSGEGFRRMKLCAMYPVNRDGDGNHRRHVDVSVVTA
ncbi:hypothetical protein KDW63_04735 [Burkholderia cenocepacia]|nr:hypothetical protein [Burkholderia cenocepacia]